MADSRDSASCVRLHRHRLTRCVDNAPISSVVAPFIIVVCIDEKPGCDRAVRIVILSAVRRSHFSPTRGGESPYIGTVDSIGLTVSATRGFDWTLTRRARRGAHRCDRAGRSRNRDDAAFDTADGDRQTNIPIADVIQDRFGLPTHVENDCTASAVGEYVYGAGREYRAVAHVTFGTGIGGGLVEDGQVLRGEDGYAAEIGLLPVCATGELLSVRVRAA